MINALNYIDNQASWLEFILFAYVSIATAFLTVAIIVYLFKFITGEKK